MSDYIDSNACEELGLPSPDSSQTQESYVLSCLAAGLKLDTRICRYIDIANLHSVVSNISKKGIEIEVNHSPVMCPKAKKVKSQPVDVVHMTPEQIEAYQERQKKVSNPLSQKGFSANGNE